MAYPVKYIHSDMPGAPVITNGWGDLVTMLDAVLVNGFNLTQLDNITAADGICTATSSVGHQFVPGQILALDGANESAFNTEVKVIEAPTPNTFTFAAPDGAPATATTAATLQAKVAPLGWECPFSEGYKRAYRSKNPKSNRHFLRIDNSDLTQDGYGENWARWARVGMVEHMTGIDEMSGLQAPFDASSTSKNWEKTGTYNYGWFKWRYSKKIGAETKGNLGSKKIDWRVVGDDFFFHLLVYAESYINYGFQRQGYAFGDTSVASDGYNTLLIASEVKDSYWAGESNIGQVTGGGFASDTDTGIGKTIFQESGDGSTYLRLIAPYHLGYASGNNVNAKIKEEIAILPIHVFDGDHRVRGAAPGVYFVIGSFPANTTQDKTIMRYMINGEEREILFLSSSSSSSSGSGLAVLAFDITGPWR